MRIALVAPLVTPISQPYAGGTQALLATLAQQLQQCGHLVTLFAREGSAVPDIKIESIAVPPSVQPANFFGTPTERSNDAGFFAQANIFLQLFLQLQSRQADFDLIHAHAFDWPAFACSTLIKSIPMLHTIHLPAVSPEINETLRILHLQGHPLKLTTVSQACADTYAPYTPFDRIIYNGIDVKIIPFSDHVPTEAPLLFAGRITPEKGVVEAIEIAERAGCPLLIAGGIYDTRYYSEQIAPRIEKSSVSITYLGALDHQTLWETMSKTAALLFPIAWDEPFGLTPVEAMAAGTPVIAFRRGAAEEIIVHGETGFLVEPGDCAQAAAYTQKLSSLSREHCRFHVQKSFSLERMLDEYERMYEHIT